MKITPRVILSLLFFVCATHAACTEDWQCGNPVYFDCLAQPECTILPGVATAPGGVFWMERCLAGGEETIVYIVRANEGGVERVITVPENDPARPAVAIKLLHANENAIYIMKKPEIYALVAGFAVAGDGYTNEFNVFQPRETTTFELAFNEPAEDTYFCWRPYYFVISRYETLNVSYNGDAITTYYQTTCNALSVENNELFWSAVAATPQQTIETRFYRANGICDNCLPPPYFASVAGTASDFEVVNGRLYYSLPNEGIKSVNVNAPDFANAQILVAPGVDVNSFKIRGGRLYYNDGSAIKAINLDGSNPTTVSLPSVIEHNCVCSGGFSGPNCNECPEGNVQWENGQASCVHVDISGWPVSCSADYHCGNIPYTRCNAQRKCECVTGFTGIPPSCSECVNGHIEWNNGIPSCVNN